MSKILSDVNKTMNLIMDVQSLYVRAEIAAVKKDEAAARARTMGDLIRECAALRERNGKLEAALFRCLETYDHGTLDTEWLRRAVENDNEMDT